MKMDLLSPERLAQGYVIVLPGIEGHSFWNKSIVNGLLDAGVPYALEIHDWTWTRHIPLINLRFGRHHRSQSDVIAAKIVAYREKHPETPVYLIGHSGGGAMALYTLAKLPEGVNVSGALLLGPAISPVYDMQPALHHTTRGLWNFPSIYDVIFLVLGTTVFGTVDGHHWASAGCLGFRGTECPSDDPCDEPHYREVPFRLEMSRYWNFGGHFGYVNRRFVAQWLAPIVQGGDVPRHALRRIARRAVKTVTEAAMGLMADGSAPKSGHSSDDVRT